MKQWKSLVSVLSLTLIVSGCGGGGLERQDLYGKVTYNGQPVPAGSIAFRPNRTKGGSGPSGFAKIEDGEYSTASAGKGSVSGPVLVIIEGAVSKKPMSPALFPPYKKELEITDDLDYVDFEVPEAPPEPKGKRSKRRSRR
jgi:hypothetical protein